MTNNFLPNGNLIGDIYTFPSNSPMRGQKIYYPTLSDPFSRSVNANAKWIYGREKMSYGQKGPRWNPKICENKRFVPRSDNVNYRNGKIETDCSASSTLILAWAAADLLGAKVNPFDNKNSFYNFYRAADFSAWSMPWTGSLLSASVSVSPAEARPGDLIFYGGGEQSAHVSIIINVNKGLDPKKWMTNNRFLIFDHGGPDGLPPIIWPLGERMRVRTKPIHNGGRGAIRRMRTR